MGDLRPVRRPLGAGAAADRALSLYAQAQQFGRLFAELPEVGPVEALPAGLVGGLAEVAARPAAAAAAARSDRPRRWWTRASPVIPSAHSSRSCRSAPAARAWAASASAARRYASSAASARPAAWCARPSHRWTWPRAGLRP